ncbi:MAG TPA: SDR family NAD(P)-dependent oxidoreductase, partial [Kofleriaceae bacterium]|nr:SDR family NAD(P)-dependent oxidoreductase [Kofleriaceae bacterium]
AEPSVAGVCNAAAVRRTHHDHRLACVGRSAGDLVAALDAFAAGEDRAGLAWGARCVGRRPRVAFVFSGQGPRWLPLGADLLDAEPVFRDVLEQCSAVLRPHVDWSLFDQLTAEPGRARWSDPGVIQPVLCAVQVALAALWRSWGVEPAAVVGHSVGEIAAAHVAGALDLDAALRVALHRGRVIRAAVGQGKMAVAGVALDRARQIVDELAPGLVSVAASNGPRTTVLSGDAAALETIVGRLDAEGVFSRMLESVEFASHSPQMEPLRDDLRRSLADLAPRRAAIPIVSTVTGELIDGTRLDGEYWATNLRQPVLFDHALTTLLDGGHDAFVEISGHPMLDTAIEEKLEARGVRGAVVASLHRDQPSRSALLGELGQLYTAGFSVDWHKVIGEPGPMVELPTYPWQRQRCWIDEADGAGRALSTERTGTTPAAAPRAAGETEFWQAIERGDLAALSRTLGIAGGEPRAALDALLPALTVWRREQCVADAWRYRVVWRSLRDDAAARLGGTWLVVTPPGEADELTRAVSGALADHGATVVSIAAAERTQLAAAFGRALDDGAAVRGVVSLVAADEAPLADHPGLTAGAALTLALIQALGDAAIAAPLWLITQGAVSVGTADRVTHPGQALIWGLGRVIGLEHPERWGGLVDVGEALDARTLERLVATLARAHDEDQLAVRPTGRFVRRLVRAPLGGATRLRHFTPRGTVLVTGGTGSLGVHVARWLARRGAQHLVLTNRRGRDVPGVAELEAELAELGVRVSVVACDVADRAALAALVHRLADAGDEIRAVFHVAGDVSLVKPLATTTVAEFASVASGKDAGAQHLHELFAGGSLDAFVLFSSITGIWGSGYQGPYSAANAFLDALAEHRRGLGLAATSVAWGPWAGKAHAAHEHELARRGLGLMDAGTALAALERALDHDETAIAVADMDWSRFAPAYAAARPRPLLDDIPEVQCALRPADAAGDAAGDAPVTGELRRALLAVEPGRRRRDILVEHCRAEVGRVLKLDPARVDTTTPLTSMGFDSVMGLELKKLLQAALDVDLPSTLVWRYPTIDALIPFLAERMAIPLDAPTTSVAPPHPSVAPEPAIDLDGLTDAEVEALLLDRLQAIEGA